MPVGFRSRQPAEVQPDPEVSLGTQVETLGPGDRLADASVKAVDPASPNAETVAPQVAGQLNAAPADPLPPDAGRPSGGVTGHPDTSVERLPKVVGHVRSAELETVSRHAEALVRQGYRLAERGAVFSARRQFFERWD